MRKELLTSETQLLLCSASLRETSPLSYTIMPSTLLLWLVSSSTACQAVLQLTPGPHRLELRGSTYT